MMLPRFLDLASTNFDSLSLPPFHSVANAVGAAIANVSGDIDTIEILQGQSLPQVLERIKTLAIEKAVAAGAEPTTVSIAEINILPVQVYSFILSGLRHCSFLSLQYVTNQATRLIVRAVGELGIPNEAEMPRVDRAYHAEAEEEPELAQEITLDGSDGSAGIDYQSYRPNIVGKEWILSETDLCKLFIPWIFRLPNLRLVSLHSGRMWCPRDGQSFPITASILLSESDEGGGGNPYPPYLKTRQMLRDGKVLRIVDHSSLPDDAVLVRGGNCFSCQVDDVAYLRA